MTEFVLDASVALRWCFENETNASAEAILSMLGAHQASAIVPDVWPFEVLNGLGKAVSRRRLTRTAALELWNQMQVLPIRVIAVGADEQLLDLALTRNLSIYDACYLALALRSGHRLATADSKLLQAAQAAGVTTIAS